MEWHRKRHGWRARASRKSDNLKQQARATSQSNKSEQQARATSQSDKPEQQARASRKGFVDLPEHLICFLKSAGDRSIRHGWRIERSRTGSAICATFRRMISKNAEGTRRAKRLRKDFWLLFIGKVTRRAMEWLRNPPWMASQKNKPERQARRTSQRVNPEEHPSPPTNNKSHRKKTTPEKPQAETPPSNNQP